MRNVMKTAGIYAACVFGFQTVFCIPILVWVLFPFALSSPIIIVITALILTRNIPVEKRPLHLFVFSIFLYLFGLFADVLAHWCALRGSPYAAGYDIWYPLYPSSSGDNWCGLYGIPAIIFMAGYLSRLFKRTQIACHSSDLTGSSENKLC